MLNRPVRPGSGILPRAGADQRLAAARLSAAGGGPTRSGGGAVPGPLSSSSEMRRFLGQASTAMLAQANQSQQNVLSRLR
jgi:hypothetical protein